MWFGNVKRQSFYFKNDQKENFGRSIGMVSVYYCVNCEYKNKFLGFRIIWFGALE